MTTELKSLLNLPIAVHWFIGLALMVSTAANATEPADWFHWRGPEANGISREKNLPATWSPKGENLLWSKPEYASRSTPITMNGKLYLVTRYKPESTEEGEQVVCLDAKTGNEIWTHHQNVFLSDAPAERVGWSAVVGDPTTGNVFWLGPWLPVQMYQRQHRRTYLGTCAQRRVWDVEHIRWTNEFPDCDR